MDLTTPVDQLGLTFRLKKSALARLNILTVEDLLLHLPFRYEDFTNAVKIRALRIDEQSVIAGKVIDIKNEYTKRRFVLQKATVQDETGSIVCTWFNQTYLTRVIHPGDEIGLVGKLEFFGKNRTFQVKEYEVLTSESGLHTTGYVPVYNETRGLSSKWLRNRINDVLTNNKPAIAEYLPKAELSKLNYKDFYTSIKECHFPKSLNDAKVARERLAFDELLLSHLAAIKRRREWEEKNKGIPMEIKNWELKIENFINSLPFTLTDGQKQAVSEIKVDLQRDVPMNRLLEGDVGSGKTIVAAIAMYIAHLNGFQSALMAPTEILANQHFKSISKLFKPLGISVGLLTGSNKGKRSSVKTKKNSNQNPSPYTLNPDITIGTHALIQKNVNFEKLGLIVIDEQQRFGVEQRSLLREKGTNPHFLTMTATPIPRTILLAIYKDLDISLLKEMPVGRQTIKTWLVPSSKRQSGYAWIKKQIIDSAFYDQAFVVCPFIEESESMNTVKAVKSEFERLQKEDLKGLKLGLLHGKMKSKEKDQVLTDFKDKKIQVLVATPVVEVGIDIPDATIMVIEAADRFGLAQLHQLRGRVGRGDKQSYCLLFTEAENEIVIKRLKYMETAHSGFELAELDLTLRGGGDLYGTAQHGVAGFKIADFSNFVLVKKAKEEAEKLIDTLSKNPSLLEKVEAVTQKLIHPD